MSVYFVQAGIGGRIKIGFSPYPVRRIAYLARFSGPDLITLAVIEGSRGVEYSLHQLLAEHRAHGEWFEPTPPVLEIVRRAAALPQDNGSLSELYHADFTLAELQILSREDGVIGLAANAARKFPASYTFGILAALIRLLANEGTT